MILHHTDCGITRLTDYSEQFAAIFEIRTDELDTRKVADQYAVVRHPPRDNLRRVPYRHQAGKELD